MTAIAAALAGLAFAMVTTSILTKWLDSHYSAMVAAKYEDE